MICPHCGRKCLNFNSGLRCKNLDKIQKKEKLLKMHGTNLVPLLSINAYIDLIEDKTPDFDTSVLKNIRNSIQEQVNTEYRLRKENKKLKLKLKSKPKIIVVSRKNNI